MFLNQSIGASTGIANESSMYEAILEANTAYHNLCMKMVKCEHYAVVNEDARMLAEAEEGFMDKLKRIAKTLYQKFISFLNRVRAEWSKLYATVITKLLHKKDKVDAILKGGKKIEAKAKVKQFAVSSESLEKLLRDAGKNVKWDSGNPGESFKKYIDEVDKQMGKADRVETDVDRKMVQDAFDFLEGRPRLIKMLEALRGIGGEVLRATEAAIDKEELTRNEGLYIAIWTTYINKLIARINFLTLDAVRICRAATKSGAVKESASILDMF